MSNASAQPQNQSNRRNDRRERRDQGGRSNRKAEEVMQHLPAGWTAQVLELDPEGTKDVRTRVRLMVFENPDRGWKVLPFMTIRTPRRMQVEGENGESSSVEVMDDMDILPTNILEVALPVSLFQHDRVLEDVTVHLHELAKKQAALPPPSKRPLTQRPFGMQLAKIARTMAHTRAQQQEVEEKAWSAHNRKTTNTKREKEDRRTRLRVLLTSIL
jgi:hypothetical protein